MASTTATEDNSGRSRKRRRVTATTDAEVQSTVDADGFDRGRPLDPSLLDYLRRLGEQLDTQVTDDEESAIMATSLAKTIKGSIYRAVVNRQGAKVLEKLTPHFGEAECSEMLAEIQPAIFALLCDRQASHACEAVIIRALSFSVSDATPVAQCLQSLATVPPLSVKHNFSTHPDSHWPILFTDERGSFIVRAIIKQPALPLTVLTAMVDSLMALKQADRIEMAFNASASPAVKELLTALVTRQQHRSFYTTLACVLLVELESEGREFSASDQSKHHVLSLMQDKVGSHLIEGALTAIAHFTELGLLSSFYRQFVSGSVLSLALDTRANHVLQVFLQVVHKRKIVSGCCEEIQAEQIKELMASNRVGVVWRLVEACGRLRTRQQVMHAQLVRALTVDDQSLPNTIRLLITTQPLSFDYLRCMLARAWLQLSLKNEPVAAALASFDSAFLLSMACDSNASRLIDTLMESPQRGESKNAVAVSLAPETLNLCRHRIGSFVLEKIFNAGSLAAKREIADKLAMLRTDSPNINKAQLVLLKKCAIDDFKHREKVWEAKMSKRQQQAKSGAE